MLLISSMDKVGAVQTSVDMTWSYRTVPNQWLQDFCFSNDFRPGYYLDNLFSGISVVIPTGIQSAYELVGAQDPGGGPTLIMGRTKPVADRKFDPRKDWDRNGSIVRALLSLGRDPIALPPSWNSETEVIHGSARGALTVGPADRSLYPGRTEMPYYGQVFRRLYGDSPFVGRILTNFVRASDTSGLQPDFSDAHSVDWWPYWGTRVTLSDFVQATADQILTWSGWAGDAQNTVWYTDMVVEHYVVNERQIAFRVSYQFTNYASFDGQFIGHYDEEHVRATSRYQVAIHGDVTITPLSGRSHYPLVGTNPITALCAVNCERVYNLISHSCTHTLPANYPWPIEPGVVTDQSKPTFSPLGIFSPVGGYATNPPVFWNKHQGFGDDINAPVHWFEQEVIRNIHPQIRSACVISSGQAMEDYKSSSNWIETFPDLIPMLKSIKDVTGFLGCIKKLLRGDFGQLSRLAHYLSQGYLAYKYGVKPTVSDISEADRIANEYVDGIRVVSDGLPKALYGRFFYRIPRFYKEVGNSPTVTVRTKMVLGHSVGSLLTWVLTLDDVGLLPTLTRIWDLVPFSFVLDWFTNLSDRFEDLDNAAVREILPVAYYVHTYEYTLKMAAKYYSPYRSVDGDPTLRVFIRERSLLSPAFRSGIYDFHPPKGLKKRLLAAGSLLFELA